jgi:hypothetical protein
MKTLPIYYLETEEKTTKLLQITENWYKPFDELGFTFDECMKDPQDRITMALMRLDENELLKSGLEFDLNKVDEFQNDCLVKFIESQKPVIVKTVWDTLNIGDVVKVFYTDYKVNSIAILNEYERLVDLQDGQIIPIYNVETDNTILTKLTAMEEKKVDKLVEYFNNI